MMLCPSEAFREQAQQVAATQAGKGIALVDLTGEQVMSTLKPYGQPLPRTGALELARIVFDSGKPAVSDFYVGAISDLGIVAIGVPIVRDGKVVYALMMAVLPERISHLLRNEHLPAGWMAGVFDRNGTAIGRTQDSGQSIGQKGPPALLRRIFEAKSGSEVLETPEGIPALCSFSRSDFSGWTMAIGVPLDELTAELRESLWLSLTAASLVFLFALLLAQHINQRIARSIQGLSTPALALASDAPIAVPRAEIKEVDELGQAIERAGQLLVERTIARDRAEERSREQQSELAHVSRVSLAGEMAAGIVHELSQPLTAISAFGRGCIRLLASPSPDLAMVKDGMADLVEQAERAGDILSRLSEFVRYGVMQRRAVPARSVIDASVALIRNDAALRSGGCPALC